MQYLNRRIIAIKMRMIIIRIWCHWLWWSSKCPNALAGDDDNDDGFDGDGDGDNDDDFGDYDDDEADLLRLLTPWRGVEEQPTGEGATPWHLI